MGKATGAQDDDLSKSFGWQLPLIVDIGGKLDPHVFLGAYAGLGIGGAGSEVSKTCTGGVSCASATFRAGVQIQYHFSPDESVNPWIGYGIGIESTAISMEGNGKKASLGLTGFEYGHFIAGFDFRVSRTFGVGPFIDLAVGKYSNEHIEVANGNTTDASIQEKAMHEWLTIGPRFVFFP
jgi:hypothetical protein